MAEQAEGAPLLREYGVKKLHRGFESLSHRHLLYHAPVAQLDRVLGYEPSGQRFESSRVRHFISTYRNNMVADKLNNTISFQIRTRSSAG